MVKKTQKKVEKASSKKATPKKTVKKTAIKKKTAVKKTVSKAPPQAVTTNDLTPAVESSQKAPAKKLTHLTDEQLVHFKELLVSKIKEITGSLSMIEDEALLGSRGESGDLSVMPIHMADIGSDNYEQEFSLNLVDSERKIIKNIMEALARIEQKTYGLCVGTGDPIPLARLEAYPWAKYCVKYAELLEKGLITEYQEFETKEK